MSKFTKPSYMEKNNELWKRAIDGFHCGEYTVKGCDSGAVVSGNLLNRDGDDFVTTDGETLELFFKLVLEEEVRKIYCHIGGEWVAVTFHKMLNSRSKPDSPWMPNMWHELNCSVPFGSRRFHFKLKWFLDWKTEEVLDLFTVRELRSRESESMTIWELVAKIKAAELRQRQTTVAVPIQRIIRGFLTRKRIVNLHAAATHIQRVYRGHLARQLAHHLCEANRLMPICTRS